MKYRYIFAGLILEGICAIFIYHRLINKESLNLWDTLWNLFAGTLPYMKSRNSLFKLPILILVLQSVLLILSGSYVRQELEGIGQTAMLLSGSRKKWWNGKILWLIEQVILYYNMLIGILCMNILWMTKNMENLCLSNSFVFLAGTLEKTKFLFVLLLIPMGTSFVFLIIQNIINICIGNLWGEVVIIVSLVVSSYKMHPLLLGNNFMMLRNEYFENSGIINSKMACMILIVTGIIAYIAGYKVLTKKDILNPGKV